MNNISTEISELESKEMASPLDPRLNSSVPGAARERVDLCCPVCLEDFEEPKILPNCKHNVCSHCLANMTRRKPAKVLCPVCRDEFSLDQNSVGNLITNSELMEIVNQSREERQKERLAKAFELCVQKMGDANKLLEDHSIFTQRRQEYADQLKCQIGEMAEKIIEKIREKEREMCSRVQQEVERHELECHQQRIVLETLVADSSVFISKVEDILNSEEEISSEARKELLSESQKIIDAKLYENLAPYDVVTAKFSPNMSVLSKIEKEGFGKVYTTNAPSFRLPHGLNRRNGETSANQPKPLEADITVKADDLGLEYFAPLSLATDGKKYIAVADPSNSNVLLLDTSGQIIKRFKPPGKSPAPLTFSGVAFINTDELLAVCGSTEVFYLSIKEGSFKMTYRTNEKYGVRYCFVTVAADGRVLLTCEPSVRQYRSCIFVYRDTPFGKPDLMFGLNGSESRLEFPFKALYHEKEYFVSDMEKGCILVYDEQGRYRRHFGGKDREVFSEGPGSSQLVLPTGMALCKEKGCFYVCDWGSSSIQVYKPDGTFIAMFTIEGRPTDIVILYNGTVVVSSKDDQWIKFYTFPSFTLT